MLALAQTVARAQRIVDSLTLELGNALASMPVGFSFKAGRMVDISRQFREGGTGQDIPLSSMVRFQRYRLLSLEVSFDISPAKSGRHRAALPTLFSLHPDPDAKQRAMIRIATHPTTVAEFSVDGGPLATLVLVQ